MYEQLLDEANATGLTVLEKYPFSSPRIRGLYCDGTIAISAQVDTEAERTVVLCEELAHARYSAGNILHDRKLERRVRERIFDRLVGLGGLIRAYLAGCREPWEIAEWLSVPEPFLEEALSDYRARYDVQAQVTLPEGRFRLALQPTLSVLCEEPGEDLQAEAEPDAEQFTPAAVSADTRKTAGTRGVPGTQAKHTSTTRGKEAPGAEAASVCRRKPRCNPRNKKEDAQ